MYTILSPNIPTHPLPQSRINLKILIKTETDYFVIQFT